MKSLIPLILTAVGIAVLSFWHGATDSPMSKAAIYLFPLVVVFGMFARSFAQRR